MARSPNPSYCLATQGPGYPLTRSSFTPDSDRPTPASGSPTGAFAGGRARLFAQVQAALAGRYLLERELGHGGMAVVYLAQNLDFQRQVAIKVMRPEKGYETGVVERFRTESLAVARLRHPHIIGVHARGEEGEILWFEMDYIEGGSLDTLILRGPLSARRVARYIAQVADALSYAHTNGILHRDIKPSNLLIASGTDHVLITDFGIAKILGTSSFTETGMTVGTLAYMSPEQLAADDLTPAADQYSLGVVAYQSLVGSVPFEGTSPAQFISAQVQTPVPPILGRDPECPPDLALLVERMLAPDPGARWPDLSVVKRAAEEIALTGSAPVLRGVRSPTPRSRGTTRRRYALGASVAVIGLCAFAWFTAKRPGIVDGKGGGHTVAPPPPLTVLPADTQHVPAGMPERQAGKDPAGGSSLRGGPRVSNPSIAMQQPVTPPGAESPGRVAPDSANQAMAPGPSHAAEEIKPATLRMTTRTQGTFAYLNGGVPITLSEGKYETRALPAGAVTIVVRSNQSRCREITIVDTLRAGQLKTKQLDPECPN